jgi:type II secretory pathway pseudopilin PulG
MKRSRKMGFILEAIAVFVMMAVLTSIAVPKIERMIDQEQSADEFAVVKNAVVEMLADSQVKTLQPAGPVRDLTGVRTNDLPPLYLADYLDISKIESDGLDCEYTFTAEGEVIQQCP